MSVRFFSPAQALWICAVKNLNAICTTPRGQLIVRFFMIGFATFSTIQIGFWFSFAQSPLRFGPDARLSLTVAMLMLNLVPWLFLLIATAMGLSAGFIAFAASRQDREVQLFNTYLVRGMIIAMIFAVSLTQGSKFFMRRFELIDMTSMQHESTEAWHLRSLGLHERALLLSAISGDPFAYPEMPEQLRNEESRIMALQPVDQHQIAELLRASLIGSTRTLRGKHPRHA